MGKRFNLTQNHLQLFTRSLCSRYSVQCLTDNIMCTEIASVFDIRKPQSLLRSCLLFAIDFLSFVYFAIFEKPRNTNKTLLNCSNRSSLSPATNLKVTQRNWTKILHGLIRFLVISSGWYLRNVQNLEKVHKKTEQKNLHWSEK